MFGHQDNNQSNAPDDSQAVADTSVDQPAFNPALPTAGTPFANTNAGSTLVTPPVSDVPADDQPPLASPTFAAAAPASLGSNDLLDIKQQALTQLSPLVGHLEQTPEEKFRTTMMMIQASDNQELVKDAYAAAQEISDEKVKAQALLDIINEINYFTQQHHS